MFFKYKKLIKVIMPLAIGAVLLVSGCSSKQNDTAGNTNADRQTIGSKASDTAQPEETQKNADDAQKKAMDGFNSLTASNPSPQQLMKYLSDNLQTVKSEDASTMIVKLEEVQKKSMQSLETKFYDESIQKKINNIWKTDFDINTAVNTEDEELKALFEETRDGGYKVETAEGFYFPIVDYGVYKKFSQFVTLDIKEYIDLMAVESDKVPAKDAALVISWDDVLKRAVNQEKFLIDYPDSQKQEDVRLLYSRYLTFAFLGLNNTPAFDYDTKEMVPGLKEAYNKFLSSSADQRLGQRFRNYVDILKKNDYKLSKEIEDYRKTAMEVS
ncbi:MAG: hypothetical protein FIA99_04975 [Ruminiclostridium sp.]|nr:hypothetical protein [Ruminiclostridium sp.]